MEYIRAELAPRRITGSGAVVVQSGRSFLGSIKLNGTSGTSGSISIWDGITAGTAASAIAVIGSSATVISHEFSYVMAAGITVQASTPSSDFTIASANN